MFLFHINCHKSQFSNHSVRSLKIKTPPNTYNTIITEKIISYRISANREETIHGRKLFAEIRYVCIFRYFSMLAVHTTYSWNIMCQKREGDCNLWVLNEIIKKIYMLKVWTKSWEPFGSCLLNSTTNPAKLGGKWAGLAVQIGK